MTELVQAPARLPEPSPEWAEWAYRLGMLAGAGLFFREAFGDPLSRNFFAVCGLLLAALFTMTLAFAWRVLGDWRRKPNWLLYAGLVVVLAQPVAAALSPSLASSALPEGVRNAMAELIGYLENIPGLPAVIGAIKGLLSFLLVFLYLICLTLLGSTRKQPGLMVCAVATTTICLFFYPTIETAVGFVLLFMFLHRQWEIALIVPPKVESHLSPLQLAFLRELIRADYLTTAETRLYLNNDANLFRELLEFRLAEYDAIAREVRPGAKLLDDPGTRAAEFAVLFLRRAVLIGIGVIYFILPDFIPGPIDDAIVVFLCTTAGSGVLDFLQRRRRG